MRKLFLAAAIAAVITVVALAFSGVVLSRWLDSQTPEIAADLPYEDPAAASRLFNKRIVDKFPIGSDADELTAFLISQRFEVFDFKDIPLMSGGLLLHVCTGFAHGSGRLNGNVKSSGPSKISVPSIPAPANDEFDLSMRKSAHRVSRFF